MTIAYQLRPGQRGQQPHAATHAVVHSATHITNHGPRPLHSRYGLVNEGNIRMLARELLEYLAVADADFKPDLTAKICALIQRFAPDRRWQVRGGWLAFFWHRERLPSSGLMGAGPGRQPVDVAQALTHLLVSVVGDWKPGC